MLRTIFTIVLVCCASLTLGKLENTWRRRPRASRAPIEKIIPTKGRPWPLPQIEVPGEGFMTINADDFSFLATGRSCEILENAFKRYTKLILENKKLYSRSHTINKVSEIFTYWDSLLHRKFTRNLKTLKVKLMKRCEHYPHLHMDEQYELKICSPAAPNEATLVSQSIWGALRGLETFSQLLVPTSSSTFIINCTQILDFPRYPHRGLLLDTSRHFLSVNSIKKTLDIMAMNKFNVFHWHIVDSESFPYQSKAYPNLSMGAWSNIHIYKTEDIASIVEHARRLGIRVIAEFDTPGHTLSWGVGQPGLLTPCYTHGAPDGTYGPIDPSKEENYKFLEKLFNEIAPQFPDQFLHLGGDEVLYDCWKSNPDITHFMAANNMTGNYKKLEDYYIARLLEIVKRIPSKTGYIAWEEVFDNKDALSSDAIFEVWLHHHSPEKYYAKIEKITAAGYQVLLSSCWYLNYIKYGSDWKKFYKCDPRGFNGTTAQKDLVLGGEACMWGEYVDDTNVIPRTWPRASSVAERLWSNAIQTSNADEAAPRLEEQRCRLLRRGYNAEPVNGPSFCEGIL